MSSWDDYVNSVLHECQMEKVAFFGLDGACWAKNPGFEITQAEALAIIHCLADCSHAAQHGLFVEGTGCKYRFIRSDPGASLQGRLERNNLFAVKASTCVIICICEGRPENADGRKSFNSLEAYANYLREAGF